MPGRNIIKEYEANNYYHVYNRGVEKRKVFLDNQDYYVFQSLLKRYLSGENETDKYGRAYKDLSLEIDLVAFCLMPNHFHLQLYQRSERAITELLQRVITSYSGYFNKRHGRVGALFQDCFKAKRIDNEAYLLHISRYIHLNPSNDITVALDYRYSSLSYYLGTKHSRWVKPERILNVHDKYGQSYKDFIQDESDYRCSLDFINPCLADR